MASLVETVMLIVKEALRTTAFGRTLSSVFLALVELEAPLPALALPVLPV